MRVEVRDSGPLKIALFEDEKELTLDDPEIRAAILKELETRPPVQQVILKGPLTRVLCTEFVSKIAATIARAKRVALDDSFFADVPRECRKCVHQQKELLVRALEEIERFPHKAKEFGRLARFDSDRKSERCSRCVEGHFNRIVRAISGLFTQLDFGRGVTDRFYRVLFRERQKPFFVEGVWFPPPRGAKLVDSYKLRNDRGIAKIYEQPHSPVGFYELELPEFKLQSSHLELMYRAFTFKLEEAPEHARFAYSDRMFSFAREWYLVMLHMLKDHNQKITALEVEKLADMLARWLTYRILEPFAHDDYITDVYVSAPPELQPIYVEHERWGKLETGIYWDTPSLMNLGEVLASRIGGSFDEVRPQLDAEIPELGMRLFLSRHPAIWPRSVEMAVRKRRARPWTQPLFLSRRTLTPLASSFLSNVLRLGSSAFIIGEMGAAKTSQIETYVPEIGPQNRIVAFQDTEELHVEEFLEQGYKIVNVRVSNSEHLEKQVNAFLRGGSSYWLITEVREAAAVRAALGAAARQGSQPVVASFHARSKREVFDLIVHIMGLHEAAFRYIDFIITTAKFSTRKGTIRRIVEIAEVKKNWSGEPSYTDLFVDDRKRDVLLHKSLFSGSKRLINKLNSFDLSSVDVVRYTRSLRFLPPDKGGSEIIPELCRRLGLSEREFLQRILLEAKVKSSLLQLSARNPEVLELPFVRAAYNQFFRLLRICEANPKRVLQEWRTWLKSR
jgi:type IV secretory pathway ATPase VirB11/archaellum biosynthesis ATPase